MIDLIFGYDFIIALYGIFFLIISYSQMIAPTFRTLLSMHL